MGQTWPSSGLGMRAHVQAEDQRDHREAVAAAGGAVRSSRGRCHHALGLLVVPARVPLARSCTPSTKCMPYSAEACVHAGTKRPSPSCGCAAHGNNVRFWSQRCPRLVRLIETTEKQQHAGQAGYAVTTTSGGALLLEAVVPQLAVVLLSLPSQIGQMEVCVSHGARRHAWRFTPDWGISRQSCQSTRASTGSVPT